MTDDQIMQIANDVDAFLMQEAKSFNISAIDLSAIINSRLRMMSASEGYEDDFDALVDHLNSQTVITSKQIH